MKQQPRVWFLASLALFLGAWYCWQIGNERQAQTRQNTTPLPAATVPGTQKISTGALTAPLLSVTQAVAKTTPAVTAPVNKDKRFPYRLANTPKNVDQLARTDSGILLRNALIDTALGTALPIPDHLRSQGDPGSYIVQARGPINAAFRGALQAANAEIISYIPNNAYLVRAAKETMGQLAGSPAVLSVLPYEPYYKLEPLLLKLAAEKRSLPPEMDLNLVLFPGCRDDAVAVLQKIGAQIKIEERTPFGPSVVVHVAPDSLIPLAQWASVQTIEMLRQIKPVNDLGRVRIAASTNNANYGNSMGLHGTDIKVNLNDTGASTHKDLKKVTLDPLYAIALADDSWLGHGTHVAGTIAADAADIKDLTKPVPGSGTNYNFSGMAPGAQLFVIPAGRPDIFGVTDEYRQETAAKWGALISNNSWQYVGDYAYSIRAASYDMAVRDALPGVMGAQAIAYVFAAGNDGFGDDNGLGGGADSIAAPGTGKNVITVGALEQPRLFYATNTYGFTNNVTGQTRTNISIRLSADSEHEVASYSSRGNVGRGLESLAGRFKPDVVAAGSWVVSCRAAGWDYPSSPTNTTVDTFNNIIIPSKGSYSRERFVYQPVPAVFRITVLPNAASPNPLPVFNIYINAGTPIGSPPAAGDKHNINSYSGAINIPGGFSDYVYYVIENTSGSPVNVDLMIEITFAYESSYYAMLKDMNKLLPADYRYDSGTSMATPMVSGLLALIAEKLATFGMTNPSPALLKAMLINGCRSAGNSYSLEPRGLINYEGWGVVNLTNSCPSNNIIGSGIFEQTTNVLQTGDSHTRIVNLPTPQAQLLPLRFTLVWTDPPGNPAAGIKLVNDLDLIITNLTTKEVYYGNQFMSGGDFCVSMPTNAPSTNSASTNAYDLDIVNNVENVFIKEASGGQFSVTVQAKRVNVNGPTYSTNFIGQDYALVISSGDGMAPNTFTVAAPTLSLNQYPNVTYVSNGVPVINQTVGANPPLYPDTIGPASQWKFFMFDNPATGSNGGKNVAFITFIPPNLSRTRYLDADIDMYVSTDFTLTNLNPAAIAAADRSVGRGGTEAIYYTNTARGKTYYIGVKSEDQQAANFGFFAIATDDPFMDKDSDGNYHVHGLGTAPIPDGTADFPQAGFVFAIVPEEVTIKRVTVTNQIVHGNVGDLTGIFSHASPGGSRVPGGGAVPGTGGGSSTKAVVLNSHSYSTNLFPPDPLAGKYTFYYDDETDELDMTRPPVMTTDDNAHGLTTFMGEEAQGAWMLTLIDNATNHVGTNTSLEFRIEPGLVATNTDDFIWRTRTVKAGGSQMDVIVVPPGVTNMVIAIGGNPLPLHMYVRYGARPSRAVYDLHQLIPANGGQVNIGLYTVPMLVPGPWYIMIYNDNAVDVTYQIGIKFEFGFPAMAYRMFRNQLETTPLPIFDDAVTNNSIFVTEDRNVADVMVDVRIDHPRIADLVMHLISPSGTRLLLAENRGGPLAVNYGSGIIEELRRTNYTWFAPNPTVSPISTLDPATGLPVVNGTLIIDYDYLTIPDHLRVYLGTNLIFDPGFIDRSGSFEIPFTPKNASDSNIVVVMNEFSGNDYTAGWNNLIVYRGQHGYVTFTERTNLTTTPIKFQAPQFDPVAQGKGTNRLFVLPEEPLTPYVTEGAYGNWQLEIWDNLASNYVGSEVLRTWRIHLALIETNPPVIPLINGMSFSSNLPSQQFVFFAVYVPSDAHFATNVWSAMGPMNFLFNQIGLPDGKTPGTLLLDRGLNGNTHIFNDVSGVPQLLPGQYYYLGLYNPNPGQLSYNIMVEFDTKSTNTSLNGPMIASALAPGKMQYYTLNIPANASAASVELVDQTGNGDLYVSRFPEYPSVRNYLQRSVHPGTVDEQINMTNSSGLWYAGVYNNDTKPITFKLRTIYADNSQVANLVGGKLMRFTSTPKLISGTSASLTLDTSIGYRYDLQGSSNLVNWLSLTNFTATGVFSTVEDVTPPSQSKFYRIVPAP